MYAGLFKYELIVLEIDETSGSDIARTYFFWTKNNH